MEGIHLLRRINKKINKLTIKMNLWLIHCMILLINKKNIRQMNNNLKIFINKLNKNQTFL